MDSMLSRCCVPAGTELFFDGTCRMRKRAYFFLDFRDMTE